MHAGNRQLRRFNAVQQPIEISPMKATGYYRPLPIDDTESLVDLDVPTPEFRPKDLLVRVEAISVNPADVKVRASAKPPEGKPRILGYDAVGIVEAVGSETRLFKQGDAVFYAGVIDRPGTYAELHAVDERIVGPKPRSLTAAQAAALPLTSLTARELLFDRLAVPYGQKTSDDAILIVNGAGGVGSILTQIARCLTGLTVIATASRPETVAWSKEMGAHNVIDHHELLDEGLKAMLATRARNVGPFLALRSCWRASSHVKQGGESYWLPVAQRGVTEMEAESEPDVCRIQENAPRLRYDSHCGFDKK
jgi:zinc-binding alcohol dehydrogenase family protein